MNDGMSIQPVMPIGNSGDFGGSGFLWLFLLIILLGYGGNGFGWGGYGNNAFGNYATQNDMQRGFDEQNNIANQREILSAVNAGTAETVSAVNNVYHDLVGSFNDKYSELQRDIAGVAVSQANLLANQNECCANTRLQIAEQSANTNSLISASKYDTSMQMAQMEARLSAKMDANEIQNPFSKIDEV